MRKAKQKRCAKQFILGFMQLQIFKYQSEEEQLFNEIRTIEQEDGSVLFGTTDVDKMLGYSNPHDAISKH